MVIHKSHTVFVKQPTFGYHVCELHLIAPAKEVLFNRKVPSDTFLNSPQKHFVGVH